MTLLGCRGSASSPSHAGLPGPPLAAEQPDLDTNATVDRYLSYDANGNLTTLSDGTSGTPLGLTYVYDAFGRLVQVKDGVDPLVNHRYNGLGHRIMWQYDVDADSDLEDAERLYFCYDERWRAVATFWDDDGDPKEQFVHHAAGQRGFGQSSYIDSVILRDRDDTGGGWASASDGVLEERVYYIQNWRADVVALIASDAELLEYVRYSSYGVATSYPKGDYDLDGDVDASDTTALSNFIAGSGGWNLDFNRDGNTDGDDTTEHAAYRTGYTGGTGGRGTLSRSGLRNRLGYAGYHFDDTINAYHVRHRVYMPEIGRWTRRDPAGYVDGMGVYEYIGARPLASVDSDGQSASRGLGGGASEEGTPEAASGGWDPVIPGGVVPPDWTPPASWRRSSCPPRVLGALARWCKSACKTAYPNAQTHQASLECFVDTATGTFHVVCSCERKAPGDCSPARHEDLQRRVDVRCNRSFRCTDGMSCSAISRNLDLAYACAQARTAINEECFGGGNLGHRIAAANAYQAAAKCEEHYWFSCVRHKTPAPPHGQPVLADVDLQWER